MKRNYYKIKKLFQQHHNILVPKNYHIHHIVPVHAGGSDEIDNLVMLSIEDHAIAHKELYEKYGNIKDYQSYKLLAGWPPEEVFSEIAAMGGRIGGLKTYLNKLGIHGANKEDKSSWGKKGGKIGGKVCKELKKGIHSDLYQSKEWLQKTGKRNGHFVVDNYDWANVEKQRERGKKGGPKNKGFIWITDGVKVYKYTAKMQQEKSVQDFTADNPQFKLGRK